MPSTHRFLRFASLLLTLSPPCPADTTFPPVSPVRQIILANPLPLEQIGAMQTQSTTEIESNPWSIGCETLGRGFADFDAYKDYLPALGAKRARIQSAWFRCEQKKGVYNFDWLDPIVDGLLERGIQPWMTVCYGNPIYATGGTISLSGGLPHGEEGLAAWDAYVKALATRYQDRIHEWEIWNEPDISRAPNKEEKYADVLCRSSKIIKGIDPDAQIWAFGLAGGRKFVDKCLPMIKERGGFESIDALTYHGYSEVPEQQRGMRDGILAALKEHQLDIPVWQGENGAPSTLTTKFALNGRPWTELSQAKWFLRRMAEDRRAGISTNIFTIADLNYRNSAHTGQDLTHNPKGLLDTDEDDKVVYPKASYYAVSHMITLFDSTVIPHPARATASAKGVEIACFRKGPAFRFLVWKGDQRPGDSFATQPVTVTLHGTSCTDPTLVDLLSGLVYELPQGSWQQEGSTTVLRNLPVGDSPLLVVDRQFITLKPKK